MPVEPTRIPWLHTYEEALETARAARRPLLLQFERDRCAGCSKLEAHTYADPDVREELTAWFIPLRLDIRRDRVVRARLHAIWTPSFYVLDASGKVYFSHDGYLPPEDLRIVLRLGWAAYALPKGQYGAVIERLDEGLRLFPDHPRAPAMMLRRGMAKYLMTWDHQAFRAEMATLVRRFPHSAEARMWPWEDPPLEG